MGSLHTTYIKKEGTNSIMSAEDLKGLVLSVLIFSLFFLVTSAFLMKRLDSLANAIQESEDKYVN